MEHPQHHTNRRMVTVAMLLSMFLSAIDATVVSTAMPHIVADLSGLSLMNWVFAIYTLTTCVTTPIFGKLCDLFGRRTVFVFGAALFVVGSMLSGAAQSMTQLVWFRALQGIGAGASVPATFTIVGDLYPGEQRAKMQGVFASVWSVAGLLGPLLGGLFVDHISWRWIFYINLPVGIVAITLALLFFHERFERRAKQIDYRGALTFTLGISALLYALLDGGQQFAWDAPASFLLFIGAAVLIALFLALERAAKEPMLPLSLYRIPVISLASVLNFLIFGFNIGLTVYLPMWIQIILGHSATSSGLTLMPQSIAWPLASNVAGRLMYRLGSKFLAVTGSLFIALGGVWLLLVREGSPYWYFVGILVTLGFGMGLVTTPMTVLVQAVVNWQRRGIATAATQFMSTLGQTVGIAVFGSVFNAVALADARRHLAGGVSDNVLGRYLNPDVDAGIPPRLLRTVHDALAGGIHSVFVVLCALGLVGIVVTALLPTHRRVMEDHR